MNMTTVAHCPEPTSKHNPNLPFYTTQLLVPISLPKDKVFIPTFHSCLASRIYVLDISLSILGSGGVASSTLLKIPIQVSSEPSAISRHASNASGFGAMVTPEDEYFRSRSVAYPSMDDYGSLPPSGRVGSALDGEMPPEYSTFSTSRPVGATLARSSAPPTDELPSFHELR